MTDEAKKLREMLRSAQIAVSIREGQIRELEQNCAHDFSEPESNPIVHAAYRQTAPHWHPGYGREEDHQIHVPERREARWTRTCAHCGKVQTTTTFDEKISKTPVPRFS